MKRKVLAIVLVLVVLMSVCLPAFADNADLDLTWVFQLCFDLFCDISCQEHHVRIVDLIRNYHYSNLSTCLNSK